MPTERLEEARHLEEPLSDRPASEDAGNLESASQWQLMRMKFCRHRLAVWAALVVLFLYLVTAVCEFVAPYTHTFRDVRYAYAPPQRVRITSEEGLHFRPFVYALEGFRDPVTYRKVYVENRDRRYPLRFFVRGEPYRFWGVFEGDLHLFGVQQGGRLHLLGTDALGRDLFSRIVYGARVSLTIGLIGVVGSFILGLVIGCLSGYYGGAADNAIQRVIEVILCFPTIPLWMALAAALPSTWSPIQVYFGITVVLSLVTWTGLARQVRGKILALREEDFATAALLSGASRARVMYRHLLPSFSSHIIVALTLSLPAMILAETALSFLGLGLRPPVTSWGVLLNEAQNVQAVVSHPWLLTPVFFVIITVLAFNFVGDGLRDAADPYAR